MRPVHAADAATDRYRLARITKPADAVHCPAAAPLQDARARPRQAERRSSPAAEFKLALKAVLAPCDDAGIPATEIDGFASYARENTDHAMSVPVVAALAHADDGHFAAQSPGTAHALTVKNAAVSEIT